MEKPGNRLGEESSPYLRQHQSNPVHWYAWGPDALELAKKENRPILLSIGYSACHWCHVMAHESFENPEIAALMNENFVNIKVDREERPDLDQIYQKVAQAMNRGGGWPLTVFLLPDQRPFFGGTYFPPEDRYGRPGFPRVLKSLAEAYRNDPTSIESSAANLTTIIADLEKNQRVVGNETAAPPSEVLVRAEEAILAGFDFTEGGFGGAPKFPNPMMLSFLFRMGSDAGIAATLLALTKMASGGIFDQIGGGFHRYSVDAKWAVPHFEKMLSDNGLLLQLYSEVLAKDRFERIAGRTEMLTPERRVLFLRTVAKTTEYLLREMEDPQGGFYAAQDADSEGEEGKFFAFDLKDLGEILTPEEARAFALRYGVFAGGNFEHGKTVLSQARSDTEVAQSLGLSDIDARTAIATAERKVFTAREARVKPGLDDKIITAWNGLAISGLIWASAALEHAGTDLANVEYSTLGGRARASAEKAFERFVSLPVSTVSPLASTLPTTIQKSLPKGAGFLDDYAFFARAALDLHRFGTKAIGSHALSEWAAIYMNRVMDSFSDPSGDPGYFFTARDHEALLQRPKSLFDQAIPSGTAVACSNLIALSELLEPGDKYPIQAIQAFGAEARTQLVKLIPHLEKSAYGHGELASALHLAEKGLRIYAGVRAPDAVMSDRDYAPYAEHGIFKGEMGEFKVCTRGACRGFDTLEAWGKS